MEAELIKPVIDDAPMQNLLAAFEALICRADLPFEARDALINGVTRLFDEGGAIKYQGFVTPGTMILNVRLEPSEALGLLMTAARAACGDEIGNERGVGHG